MKSKIEHYTQWLTPNGGNSLKVVIPCFIVKRLSLKNKTQVKITIEKDEEKK